MSYIQREIDRLNAQICQAPAVDHYDKFKAAMQALKWALDPVANRSPFELITWNDEVEINEEITGLLRAGGVALSAGGVVSQAQ